jgi:hypothetical protein
MVQSLPKIPWQLTGNHWLTLPCLHPADGSLHAVSAISHDLRGAIDFAGAPGFVDAEGAPLLRWRITVDGEPVELSGSRMAWQRVLDWLPTFNTTLGDLTIRGTAFAPCGRRADFPGFVYALSLENRGSGSLAIECRAEGVLGLRQHRVRTPRPFTDASTAEVRADVITLSGSDPRSPFALALAGESGVITDVFVDGESAEWSLSRSAVLAPGERVEVAVYAAMALERDGATAAVDRMRGRGWRALADDTHAAIGALQQSTGNAAVDRLVNRHLVFAYFCAAARAIDDARWYLMRTRVPWHSEGITLRDWDALMWTVPAVQLADPELGRELLVRTCELHGYAPGRGVNYIDGTPFDLAFCSAAAAAYPAAVDAYIAQTGDDRIVEDAPIAEALYAAHDDIAASRHPSMPLYATDATPSGADAELPYTLHGNALIAHALDILKQTLDEKSAEKVEEPDGVRAAILRHFTAGDAARATLVTATDLEGTTSLRDDPVGSVLWIPQYRVLSRDDSLYRRTVRRVEESDAPIHLAERVAHLVGPDAATVLEWLRRAPLDGGFAAEIVTEDGAPLGNGGDAALSALLAHTVWDAANALGIGGR